MRATDEIGLTTSSTNQGRLTINAQVAGDASPNGLLSFTGTDASIETLHLDLAGTATDDMGVAGVRVALEDQDTGRYVQPNGTMAAAFATLHGDPGLAERDQHDLDPRRSTCRPRVSSRSPPSPSTPPASRTPRPRGPRPGTWSTPAT